MGEHGSRVRHLCASLGAGAGETVCRAGVPYGRLVGAAKAEIERQRPGGPLRRAFRWANFDLLLRHPRMLRLAGAGLRLYQASGLQTLVRKSGLVRVLPGTLPAWESLLPPLPAPAQRAPLAAFTPAAGARRGRRAMR